MANTHDALYRYANIYEGYSCLVCDSQISKAVSEEDVGLYRDNFVNNKYFTPMTPDFGLCNNISEQLRHNLNDSY